MLDLSILGIRVVAPPEFSTGQIVEIIPNEGSRFAEWAKVVWVNPSGIFEKPEAGLQFLKPRAKLA